MRRSLTRFVVSLATLAVLAPCQSGQGQPGQGQSGEGQSGERQDPGKQKPTATAKKLTAWPKLKKTKSKAARAKAMQFRKRKAELREKAEKQLIAIGAGVAPILIPMVNDRHDGLNEHLFAVLEAVITPEHAALLARETKRPSLEWRRYLMRKLATFHDADIAPIMAAALKDKDGDIAFYAGLGLLSLGKHDGLDTVLLAAKQRWAEFGPLVSKVLPAGRSNATAMPIFEKIASARPTDQMAGLRLLRYLMVKDQGMLLRKYLKSSDFTVKREAINTARVLHGEKALEKLASFQAIEMAKQWLTKI